MWNAWKPLGSSIYDPCQDSGSRSFDLPSPFLASTTTSHEKPIQQLVPVSDGWAPAPDSVNLTHTCIAITQHSTSFILASHSIEMMGYSTARTRSTAGLGVLHFCFSVIRDKVRANSPHLMLYPITSSAGRTSRRCKGTWLCVHHLLYFLPGILLIVRRTFRTFIVGAPRTRFNGCSLVTT